MSSRRTASDRPLRRLRGDALGGRQAFGMLLEPFDAEELLADGCFAIPRYGLRRAPEGEQSGYQSGPFLREWLRSEPGPRGLDVEPPA